MPDDVTLQSATPATAPSGTVIDTAQQADGSHRQIVQAAGMRGTFTDGSGTITTGGASQQIFAANTARSYLLVQNLSAEALFVGFGVAAAAGQPSVKLVASGAVVFEFGFVPTSTVTIIGATTGSAFTAKQA